MPNCKHSELILIFKVRSKLQFRGMVRNDGLLFSYICISVEAQQVVVHVKIIGYVENYKAKLFLSNPGSQNG